MSDALDDPIIHIACLPRGQKDSGMKTRFRILATAFGAMPVLVGCGAITGVLLPDESTDPVDPERFELLCRFVHITDAQIVDEESPGRLTFAARFSSSAWRPHEAYSTQLLDGMIRTINKMHVAGPRIDFVIHTGDATDNAQLNELQWFIKAFDGGIVDPRSGPDDRDPSAVPGLLLDPHHPFEAQGLYRSGVHGPRSTIAWYSLFGNHDRFAVGVFPIITDGLGRRTAPLPLEDRIGLLLPVELDPVGALSWAPIKPGQPGPPTVLNLPTLIQPSPLRRYVTAREFIDAHFQSVGDPPGHGFDTSRPDQTWFSVTPVAGLRLIGLNSADPAAETPTRIYSEGAISLEQAFFLQRELKRAQDRGEWVIVATHHPSDRLDITNETALIPSTFRKLLNRYPCVKLHLAGHLHTNLVIDRGGYIEMVTSSIIDAPQQGRVVEIWGQTGSGRAKMIFALPSAGAGERTLNEHVEFRYRLFSHLFDILPPDDSHTDLFDDPLLPLRRIAAQLAGIRIQEHSAW